MPSHGALSKAGKVRLFTGNVEKDRSKRNHNPRVNNRGKYRRRVILGRNMGREDTQADNTVYEEIKSSLYRKTK